VIEGVLKRAVRRDEIGAFWEALKVNFGEG